MLSFRPITTTSSRLCISGARLRKSLIFTSNIWRAQALMTFNGIREYMVTRHPTRRRGVVVYLSALLVVALAGSAVPLRAQSTINLASDQVQVFVGSQPDSLKGTETHNG